MILSFWFWGRKKAGRRQLFSVSGVIPLLFIIAMVFLSILASLR